MVKTPEKNVGSKIIRERAMAVLRETRAKIDPHLLAAMKDRFSSLGGLMGQGQGKKPVQNPPSFSQELNKVEARDMEQDKKTYPSQKFVEDPAMSPESKTEPVDRQKIAQIVLEYMKHKDNGQRH